MKYKIESRRNLIYQLWDRLDKELSKRLSERLDRQLDIHILSRLYERLTEQPWGQYNRLSNLLTNRLKRDEV
jgi:hypothetical protein